MITFGPVPSRRLGQSLGINNIPPKICSYACVYCQIGTVVKMDWKRQEFYNPDEIVRDVEQTVKKLEEKGEKIDYLSFVPDGEPTLDINLGKEIEMLKPLGIPIAVITNSSLLWDPQVREELANADLVSVKVDTVTDYIWRRLDKAHKALDIEKVKHGIEMFASRYEGILYTETMLVKGFNDREEELEKIARFISDVSPHVAYIGIPTRPPAEDVQPPEELSVNMAYQIFSSKIENVELLLGMEAGQFGSTGNVVDDILNITAVHPMSFDAIDNLLVKNGKPFAVVYEMIEAGLLEEVNYQGKKFYVRRFKKRTNG